MKQLQLSLALLPLLLLAGRVNCQPRQQQDAARQESAATTAQQVFDNYTKALGGKEVIQKIKSRVIKGTVEYNGVDQHATAPIEIYWKAPDKFFAEMRAPFGAIKRGFTGTEGWGIHPQAGFRQLSPTEVMEDKRQMALYQPANLSDLYTRMASEERKNINGRETDVIAAVTKEGKTERFYFDAATHLPLRLDLWEEGPEGVIAGEFYLAEIYLDDYKVVDGVRVPFYIRRVRPNTSMIFKFSEVKQNVDVDEKVFDMPQRSRDTQAQ